VQPDIDDGSVFDATRQQSLITLAEATGGFSSVRSNDVPGAFSRIVTESSGYYLLGYVSTNTRRDGTYRDIDVRTTRPGLRVLARSGYVAPKGAPAKVAASSSGLPPALADMLKTPLAVSGLPLTVSAPVFRSGSKSKAAVVVVVEAGGRQLLLTATDGRFNGGLTIALAAADGGGKVQAMERGALTMRLSPQTRDAMVDRGARVVSQLELKPGRYELKVAAIDSADGTTKGSVLYDLDVPDFSKGLTMSGVVLTSLTEAPVPTVSRDARLRETLGEFPTARREFTRFEELRAYIEIYDTGQRAALPLVVTTRVLDDRGMVVFRREVTSTGESGSDKVVTHRVATTIALNDLRSGRYVLEIETARDNSQRDEPGQPAARRVPFSIR
jgi:hypothetical protein